MRVVGEQGTATGGMATIDDPVVRTLTGQWQKFSWQVRDSSQVDPQSFVDDVRLIRGQVGIKAGGLFRAQLVNHGGAQGFLTSVAAKVQRHDLQPRDGICRRPEFRLICEKES